MLLIVCMVLSLVGCTDIGPKENSTAVSSERPLAEVLEVPEHVSDEFVLDSGISRVHVDAEIVFPEVDHVDVIEALPRVFTEEEIQSMITRYEDEIGWYDMQTADPIRAGCRRLRIPAAGLTYIVCGCPTFLFT